MLWNLAFMFVLLFADELMFVTTFASMLHIHRNSKIIEHIGVKTNSRLMKVYLIFWTSLNYIYLAHVILIILIAPEALNNYYGDPYDEMYVLKLIIAFIIDSIIILVLISALDLMIMLAYYRLSKKLSTRATKRVIQALRAESIGSLRSLEQRRDDLFSQK